MRRDDGLSRVLAVAALTLREASRRKIVLVAVLMSAAFLALYGLGLHYAAVQLLTGGRMGIDELLRRGAAAQMLYIGLFPASFIIALAAVFASVSTISGEVESGVAYAVLARPIRRSEVVLGKFLGLGALLVSYALVLDGAVIALAAWQIHAPVRLWPGALALMTLEPLVLLGLALLGSTRLPTLANGVLCTAAYGIGVVGGFIEQIGGLIRNDTMVQLGIVTSLLTPLDAVHRKALSLLLPGGLLFGQGTAGVGLGESATPSTWMMLYAVGYVAVAVLLATRVLRRRDL
ncbi:MAG TPA: ABC transporter permease subunit [Coriobacteriia bacterium]|jgi:ABC-type transport system involved in multi-copper enzyme maturation permease subunit